MEQSFELNGKNFKLSKINAFKQFHIVRRISPILSELLPVLQQSAKKSKDFEKLSEDEQLEMTAKFASPVMLGLSKLTDEDSEYVLFGLLSAVEIQHMGSWAKIANGSMLMIQDLELPMLMQVAGRAFMFNLSGFFAGTPQK